MVDKEDTGSPVTLDLDKEQPALLLSKDDVVLPLFMLTIVYGVFFSVSAVVLNAIPPQLWTPSPIMTRAMAFFTSQLSNYIDVALLTSHPLDVPAIVYHLPALIYIGLNILVLWLFKPQKRTSDNPATKICIPVLCIIFSLGVGALIGLSFWEEVLITIPLTMSFFVLPWYFAWYRKRILRADVGSSTMK